MRYGYMSDRGSTPGFFPVRSCTVVVSLRPVADIVDHAHGDGCDSFGDHGVDEHDLAATPGLRPERISFHRSFQEGMLHLRGFGTPHALRISTHTARVGRV